VNQSDGRIIHAFTFDAQLFQLDAIFYQKALLKLKIKGLLLLQNVTQKENKTHNNSQYF